MNDFSGKSARGSGDSPASSGSWENPGGPAGPDRPQTRRLWWLPVLLGGLIVYLIVSGHGSLMKLHRLAQKRDALIQSNQELNRTNQNIYREITRLKEDPLYLEEIARKEFGLVKAEEIIFFLDQEAEKERSP